MSDKPMLFKSVGYLLQIVSPCPLPTVSARVGVATCPTRWQRHLQGWYCSFGNSAVGGAGAGQIGEGGVLRALVTLILF